MRLHTLLASVQRFVLAKAYTYSTSECPVMYSIETCFLMNLLTPKFCISSSSSVRSGGGGKGGKVPPPKFSVKKEKGTNREKLKENLKKAWKNKEN